MPAGTILIADDDAAIRTVLNQALGRAGYDVRTTGTAAGLWRWVAGGDGNLVITDVVLPDENGFDLIPRIKRIRPDLPVVVMSAQNTILTAITAAERGAFEYLPKPFDLKELTSVVQRALRSPQAKREPAERREAGEERLPLIGRSPAMQEIYRVIARLTQTDLTVMIMGESGTGKELVARALARLRQTPATAPSSPSTWRRFRKSSSKANCSGTSAAPSPAPPIAASAVSSRPKAARCSSTRSATCRWKRRRGSCACCSRANTRRSAAARRSRPMCASSPPPIAICASSSSRVCSARISTTASTSCRCACRRCASAARTFPILARHFLRKAEEEGLPAKHLDARSARPAAALSLAGKRARAGKSHPPPGRAAFRRHHSGRGHRRRIEGARADGSADGGDEPASLSAAVERHLANYFAEHGDRLPPPGLYDRILQEIERPLLSICLAATRGNQIRAAHLLGLNRNTLRKKIRDLGLEVIRGLKTD